MSAISVTNMRSADKVLQPAWERHGVSCVEIYAFELFLIASTATLGLFDHTFLFC